MHGKEMAGRNGSTGLCRKKYLAVVNILFILFAAAVAQAASAFIRVNQLGYEVNKAARAYLMSKHAEEGAVFEIRILRGR